MRAPLTAVIVTLGRQSEELMLALEGFRQRDAGIAVRHLDADEEAMAALALPAACRLAWLFVNEADLRLPVVRACHQHLSALAPVTIAVHVAQEDSGDAEAACAGFAGGVFLQSYTSETLARVVGCIENFISRPPA